MEVLLLKRNVYNFRRMVELKQEKKGMYLDAVVRIPNPQDLIRVEITLVSRKVIADGNSNIVKYYPHCNLLFVSEFKRKSGSGSSAKNYKPDLAKFMTAKDHTVVLNFKRDADGRQVMELDDGNHKYLNRNVGEAVVLGDEAWNPHEGLNLNGNGLLLTVIMVQTKKTHEDHMYLENMMRERNLEERPESLKKAWLQVKAVYTEKSERKTITQLSDGPLFHRDNFNLKPDLLYPARFCNERVQALVFHQSSIPEEATLRIKFFYAHHPLPRMELGEDVVRFLSVRPCKFGVAAYVQFNVPVPNEMVYATIDMEIYIVIDDFFVKKDNEFPLKRQILVMQHKVNDACMCDISQKELFDMVEQQQILSNKRRLSQNSNHSGSGSGTGGTVDSGSSRSNEDNTDWEGLFRRKRGLKD